MFKLSPAVDPRRSTTIEGWRGAGVLDGNAIVVPCGEFGFEETGVGCPDSGRLGDPLLCPEANTCALKVGSEEKARPPVASLIDRGRRFPVWIFPGAEMAWARAGGRGGVGGGVGGGTMSDSSDPKRSQA